MAGKGHNSDAFNVTADELKSFVDRRLNLDEEKDRAAQDIKELHAELKGRGFDLGVFNEMIRLRKMDADDRKHREEIRTVYADALDIFG